MKKLFYLVVFFLCWIELPLTAGNVRLLVNAGRFERQDCIVAADVSSIPLKEGYEFVLFELNGKKKVPVASQLVVEDGKALLYFTLEGITQVNEVREFLLKTKKPKARASFMEVEDDSNSLIVKKALKSQGIWKVWVLMPSTSAWEVRGTQMPTANRSPTSRAGKNTLQRRTKRR